MACIKRNILNSIGKGGGNAERAETVTARQPKYKVPCLMDNHLHQNHKREIYLIVLEKAGTSLKGTFGLLVYGFLVLRKAFKIITKEGKS